MTRRLRVAVWNAEWRSPRSEAGREIRRRLTACDPDIICLTEAKQDFFSEGYAIHSEADYGYPLRPGRRKVQLWSRAPWSAVTTMPDSLLPPGRFVAGTTRTENGEVRVTGVCVPWAAAHVSTGRRDRRRWQDHLAYLEALPDLFGQAQIPTLVLGDFNQTVPRSTAPLNAWEALHTSLLTRCSVATNHEAAGAKRLIDHIMYSGLAAPTSVRPISNLHQDGRPISDHIGAVAEFLMVT